MLVKLISITENPEKHIEKCGRICYDSVGKIDDNSVERFIKMIINNGHESVLEHASATFHISGVSRSLSHQIVRHRLASFSQRSQRYVSEEMFKYVTPPSIDTLEKIMVYQNVMDEISKAYNKLIELDVKREDARFVLPNACETEFAISANFREYRHIFKERLSKAAQWEIREMSKLMLKELKKYAPNVFGDF